jgi:hypothetical protein
VCLELSEQLNYGPLHCDNIIFYKMSAVTLSRYGNCRRTCAPHFFAGHSNSQTYCFYEGVREPDRSGLAPNLTEWRHRVGSDQSECRCLFLCVLVYKQDCLRSQTIGPEKAACTPNLQSACCAHPAHRLETNLSQISQEIIILNGDAVN